jgi:hypothetical protein
MPMTEMRVGDQTIRCDREATAAVYGTLEHGDAEECGCTFCKNFAVQRELIYPASFRALIEQLGVDPNKEGEIFECGPVEDGRHLYGGWFYFVGEMVTAGERNHNAPDSHLPLSLRTPVVGITGVESPRRTVMCRCQWHLPTPPFPPAAGAHG